MSKKEQFRKRKISERCLSDFFKPKKTKSSGKCSKTGEPVMVDLLDEDEEINDDSYLE